ncbi:hypothetical protein TH53_04775 [Pedobacter lusitanus]|uniref:Uncharacterized protein n=1 Tax=Pedobacter lusitanus TaxID=1503925 RepID=A0A0D0G0B8_9SPHI|nr:hypothetical protein TH53_04775 [Pedobacter lusitanus]
MSALGKKIAQKSDAQLIYYIENIDKHTDEAVKLAVSELQNRNIAVPENIFEEIEIERKARLIKKNSFIRQTLLFCIPGFFFSSFTLMGILGIHSVISLITDCITSWTIIWITTGLGAIILPLLFFSLYQGNGFEKTSGCRGITCFFLI